MYTGLSLIHRCTDCQHEQVITWSIFHELFGTRCNDCDSPNLEPTFEESNWPYLGPM